MKYKYITLFISLGTSIGFLIYAFHPPCFYNFLPYYLQMKYFPSADLDNFIILFDIATSIILFFVLNTILKAMFKMFRGKSKR